MPAGSFDADRFALCGPAADMPPDPLLATIVDTVTDPAGSGVALLSDDQLIGVIAAARRLESRVAWYQLAAVAEFTARAARESFPADFAADELACELHLTASSAGAQMDYAQRVAGQLPRCLAALFAGRMHPVHLRIIDDETQILAAENAAKADATLAEIAGTLTFGKLRSAAHRLVLELDPEAAAKRKAAARRNAQVRPFREESGNAGMIARELPSAEVLASMQHVEQRALDLRAAGVPGSLQELQVRAYLDLLQERDTRLTRAAPDAAAEPGDRGGTCGPGNIGGTSGAGGAGGSAGHRPGGSGCTPTGPPPRTAAHPDDTRHRAPAPAPPPDPDQTPVLDPELDLEPDRMLGLVSVRRLDRTHPPVPGRPAAPDRPRGPTSATGSAKRVSC